MMRHPIKDAEFDFDCLKEIGGALQGDRRAIDGALQGDRRALAAVFAQCALAIEAGYPLPQELGEFLSGRLMGVVRLLVSCNSGGSLPAALDARQVQRALLGDLKRGGAVRWRQDLKPFVQEEFTANRKMGRTVPESKQLTLKMLANVFGTKMDMEYLDRLISPSRTKGTPPKPRRVRKHSETK